MLQQQNAVPIHQLSEPFRGPDGVLYDLSVWGYERPDATWVGWLEFVSPLGIRLTTDRETTQSKLEDLSYWSTGLEPIYLEGAFRRAQPS
jgi:hypothetical protein